MHTGLWKRISMAAGGLALLGAAGMAQAVPTLDGDGFDITLTPTSDLVLNGFLVPAPLAPDPYTLSTTVGTGVEYIAVGSDSGGINNYVVKIDVNPDDVLNVEFVFSGSGPVTPIEYILSGLEFRDVVPGGPVTGVPGGLSFSDTGGTTGGATGSAGPVGWSVSGLGAIKLTWDPGSGNLGGINDAFAFTILKATPTPEPASLALLGLGLAGLGFAGRRRGR